jgi:hypothetical protein
LKLNLDYTKQQAKTMAKNVRKQQAEIDRNLKLVDEVSGHSAGQFSAILGGNHFCLGHRQTFRA